MTAAERALLRVREEMNERHISQRDLAALLRCSQGRITKILNGGVNLRVDDLETLADAVGLRLTELVRDRGLEFYAEMTPSELRIFQTIRRSPKVMQGVMILLDIPGAPESTAVVPKRGKRGRPMFSELKKREAKKA